MSELFTNRFIPELSGFLCQDYFLIKLISLASNIVTTLCYFHFLSSAVDDDWYDNRIYH